MKIVPKEISNYCLANSSAIADYFIDIERSTHLKTLAPQMLCGTQVGQLLALFVQIMDPDNILEIGTFTGYSTAWLAKNLKQHAKITSIEGRPENKHLIDHHLQLAGCTKQVELIIGDATEVLPTLSTSFDLVFIDANKREYKEYFLLCFEKIRSGGMIIVDNTLWSGQVLDSGQNLDSKYLHEFNTMVKNDDRLTVTLLPIRDGLSIIRKI